MNSAANAPQNADEKLATLKMTLRSDSGFRSQSDGDRISANQWRDIMLVIADAEAYRMMRGARDMLEALRGALPLLEEVEGERLVGDEGCLWPVEAVRAAIANAAEGAS